MQTEYGTLKRRLLSAIFAVLGVGAVALSGCSTIEGMGEDAEYVGEKISESSRDVQD